MRNLYFVEQDHIFQLGGVADNGSFTYDRIAADECTVAYFCFFSDDCRSVNVSPVGATVADFAIQMSSPRFRILLRLRSLPVFDKIADLRKHFPRINGSFKQIFCNRFLEIIEILILHVSIFLTSC